MRRRRELRPDANAQFTREIGWKASRNGHPTQPRFYLGTDLQKAELANLRLEQLWQILESEYAARRENGSATEDRAYWTGYTLDMARAIARGETRFAVERDHRFDDCSDEMYFWFVQDFAERFGSVMAIVPEDGEAFALGREKELELAARMEADAARIRAVANGSSGSSKGPSLHQAMDAYAEWIKKEFRAPDAATGEQMLTPWGLAQTKNVGRLKERHPDVPLDTIRIAECEAMFRVWRQRPQVKGRKAAIKPKTAIDHLKQLKRFFKWLHRSPEFDWRKPEDFEDIPMKIEMTVSERARRLSPRQVDSFNLEQVTLLNEYATPLERAFLLIGVNCGFGKAEIGTLVIGEIALNQRHPDEKVLGFQSSEADSFIKRIRHKNGVYGEFLLWPQTVQAIQWVIENRKRRAVGNNGDEPASIVLPPESLLFLTEDGHSYLTRSTNGNANQRIPNIFAALIRRVRKDHRDFPKFSFGKLRKTGANFVKKFSDGEVAATFLCHGQAVKVDDLADVYTDRPIGKVFEALRRVEKHLEPMFAAAPENPFPEERKKGGLNIALGLVRKMQKLRNQGFKVDAIAKMVGVDRTTVVRHTKKQGG